MTFLVHSKEMLEHEAEEMKWRLEKETEKYQTVNARNRELSDQLMELSQKVIIFEEK